MRPRGSSTDARRADNTTNSKSGSDRTNANEHRSSAKEHQAQALTKSNSSGIDSNHSATSASDTESSEGAMAAPATVVRNGAQPQSMHAYDQVPNSSANTTSQPNLSEIHLSSEHSFWALNQYKRSVRRIEDGLSEAHSLKEMLRERGELEAAYAKGLKTWAKTWTERVGKSPEYGSMQRGLLSLTEAAERRADLHFHVRDRLSDEVLKTLKLWQKDNYHQRTFKGGVKEAKDIEADFRKVQKPWAKLFHHVERAKKEFHAACKSERTAINQEKNAQGDQSVSPEQQKRFADKVAKCRDDRDKARLDYTNALADLNAYNGKYMEEMTMVFERCQELERKRLRFFKEMLCSARACLDVSAEPKLGRIYAECSSVLAQCDAETDVRWWAENFGTGMAMAWPTFEEYTPELRPIANQSRKGLKSEAVNAGGVILMRQSATRDAVDSLGHERVANGATSATTQHSAASSSSPQHSAGTPPSQCDSTQQVSSSTAAPPPVDNRMSTASALYGDNWDDVDEHEHDHAAGPNGHTGIPHSYNTATSDESGLNHPAATNGKMSPVKGSAVENRKPPPIANVNANANANVVHDDDEEEEIDLPEPVPVKALYDYDAQEDDELTLVKGELFEKLAEADDQGWCKGRKNDRIGLYPANYAAPIAAV